jgi:hypothetical protein
MELARSLTPRFLFFDASPSFEFGNYFVSSSASFFRVNCRAVATHSPLSSLSKQPPIFRAQTDDIDRVEVDILAVVIGRLRYSKCLVFRLGH